MRYEVVMSLKIHNSYAYSTITIYPYINLMTSIGNKIGIKLFVAGIGIIIKTQITRIGNEMFSNLRNWN